ncbi:hypothetical protein H0H92_005546, partial [Tricholoma furcatifolium]
PQEASVRIDLEIWEEWMCSVVLGSLRLDELVSVEVDSYRRSGDVWTALGNLPHIEKLKVCGRDIQVYLSAIEALCPHSPAHRVFPALMTLTITLKLKFQPRTTAYGAFFDLLRTRSKYLISFKGTLEMDPKVEEPNCNTPHSRAEAHKYIEEQIRVHSSIVHYYKKRWNALTVTCRLPTEILTSIFSHCGLGFKLNYTRVYSPDYAYYEPPMAWIVPILHVCSHWREAALSTPSLWSTIHVEFPGALQMLDRSKGVALSVISYDAMPRKVFDVLNQVLASPLHHIKDLLVRPKLRRSNTGRHNHIPINGFGLNWGLLHTFNNLKTFIISIPESQRPSMIEILRFLSQMPLLDFLSITASCLREEVLPCHATKIHLKYLKHIEFICDNIITTNTFFDHLSFPKNDITLVARIINDRDSKSGSVVQQCVQTMDNATDGLVSRLVMTYHDPSSCCPPVVEFSGWKSGTKLQPPGSQLWEASVRIDLEILSQWICTVVLGSLRLDELVSVEVDNFAPRHDVWTALGNLPRIEELKVCGGNIRGYPSAIEALCPHSPAHRVFPALMTLTISECDFHRFPVYSFGPPDVPYIPITERLLLCSKLRADAGIPLKSLRIERCKGVKKKYVAALRGEIDEVYYDAYIN